jgi:hypothetical protein
VRTGVLGVVNLHEKLFVELERLNQVFLVVFVALVDQLSEVGNVIGV